MRSQMNCKFCARCFDSNRGRAKHEMWCDLNPTASERRSAITSKISASLTGKVVSEETRQKMSNSAKGKTKSIETRQNMSAKQKNMPDTTREKLVIAALNRSDETKAKIAKANTGKVRSEEARQNIISGRNWSDEVKSVAYEKMRLAAIKNRGVSWDDDFLLMYNNACLDGNRIRDFKDFLVNSNCESRTELSIRFNVPISTLNGILRNFYLGDLMVCDGAQTSYFENEVCEFVKSLGVSVIENDRSVLGGKELDILCPDQKVAIECNGLYWHSENNGKDKEYHLNKTTGCLKNDIQLIHIWEPEWMTKSPIVKSMLRNKLGLIDNKIHARKCKIVQLSSKQSRQFLETNHIQGHANASIRYGLVYNDELVFVMTFGAPRFNKNYRYELIRMATKLNTIVVGGFSKLLKYVKNNHQGSIITYSERRLFPKQPAYAINMQLVSENKPGWFVHKHGVIYHRSAVMKHTLIKKYSDRYDHAKSNDENMNALGYYRIWDCGQWVYDLN